MNLVFHRFQTFAVCLFAAAILAASVLVTGNSGASAQSATDRERMMRPLTDPNAPPPAAPEVVVTRGWGNEKFARIVFDWRAPVKFSAKVVGNQLRISFERPLQTEFDRAAKSLAPFLSELQLQASGTAVSANLRGYYSLRSFSSENTVVIDLIPEESALASQDEDPDAWLKRTPVIPVRAGEHPGFGRMVFDWSDEVGYDIQRDGDVVRMRFDRPARVDVSRLSSTLPGRVSAASTETTRSAVRVGLIIPPEAEIRHFRDGPKVALDIIAPAEHHKKQLADDEHDGASKTGNKMGHGSEPVGPDGDAAKDAQGKTPLSLTQKARRQRLLAEREQRRNAEKFKAAPLVTVETTRRGSALDIKFNWRKDVAAAVFRRGEQYWILFDGRARLGMGNLQMAGEGMVEQIEQTDAAEKSLLRLKVPEHLIATATKTGTNWNVRLAPARMTGPLQTPIEIRSDIDGNKEPAVLIAAKGLGRPHVFADRISGDIVHVYPVMTPGVGNRIARNLVDVSIPASAAGLVLVPRRDDIALIRNAEGVYVAAPGGLSVSRSLEVAAESIAKDSGHAFGALDDWGGGPDREYEDEKYAKLERVLVAPAEKRNSARLDLARFYISRGMAADALGILEVALEQAPAIGSDTGFIALRAAAHYLLGKYATAAPDFEHVHLKNDPSVAPWRAGIASAKGDWLAAYKLIRDSRGIVASFPKWLKTRFQMIGAEAALAAKDTDSAKLWLDALGSSSLSDTDSQYLKFLNGHALRLQGKPSAAKSLWRDVVENGDRRARAKAAFALVNADIETNQTDRKKAIEALEALSFAWRGDAFEFDLKRRLGDLHADEGEYREALLRLRQAASNFRDVEGAKAIAEDMRNRFRSLFLDGEADKLSAVKALALYEEFRELTPAGSDGDEMIRKLADRLAKVDLLSEAGRLLEHQVRFRLKGMESSRVGSRLALLRLLNREPEKAIEALELSEGEELPSDLEFQRRYLKVRAYGDNNEPEKGHELLAGDVSYDAEMLRLGLYWKNANWEDVARTVRRIIPQQNVEELAPKNADMVLRWGIALTMESDTEGLAALRDRFGPAMEKTKYKEAFKAIAGVEIGLVPDFKELVRKTGDLEDYQSFLASYRDKVQSNALSAIN